MKVANERVVAHSLQNMRNTADSYRVGALARYTLNSRWLNLEAKSAAAQLHLSENLDNSYYNSVAQIVECVHAAYDSVHLIDTLLERDLHHETIKVVPRSGKGAAAVEVPRGILFHEYEYDEHGIITQANCIIPTGQNLANIENDLRALVPSILRKSREDATLDCEMLVRAYDPCISCATHAR